MHHLRHSVMPSGLNPANLTGTNKEIPQEADPACAEMPRQAQRRVYGGGTESQASLCFLHVYMSISVSNAQLRESHLFEAQIS